MQYYFAYGSNLHHAQMKRRCPKCRFIKKYILNNYQLTFRSKYGACDIEKKIGKKVYGALFFILLPHCLIKFFSVERMTMETPNLPDLKNG